MPKNRLPHRHIRDSYEPVIGQAIEYLDIIGKCHSNKRQIESDDEFEDYLSFIISEFYYYYSFVLNKKQKNN